MNGTGGDNSGEDGRSEEDGGGYVTAMVLSPDVRFRWWGEGIEGKM